MRLVTCRVRGMHGMVFATGSELRVLTALAARAMPHETDTKSLSGRLIHRNVVDGASASRRQSIVRPELLVVSAGVQDEQRKSR